MIINKIEIGGFGGIINFNLNLFEGLQIIYGGNEYGKSTLMEFIKIMLYGNQGKSVNASIRESRLPWNGEKMRGAIEFYHNGHQYRVQKEIDPKTPSKDKVLFQDRSLMKNINIGKKEEVGEWLFGIDFKSFETIAYINQFGKIEVETKRGCSGDLITIIDTSSGNSNLSDAPVRERIDKAIRELRWKNGAGGKIIELESSVNIIQQKLYELRKKETEQENKIKDLVQTENLICERTNIQNTLQQLEAIKGLKRINEIKSSISKRQEYIKLITSDKLTYNMSCQLINDLENKRQQINKLISETEALKKSLNNMSDEVIPITKEETEAFSSEEKRNTNLKELIKELQIIIMPEIKQYKGQKKLYETLNEKLNSSENQLSILIKAKEKYLNTNESLNKLISERDIIIQKLNLSYKEFQDKDTEIKIIDKSTSESWIHGIKILSILTICALVYIVWSVIKCNDLLMTIPSIMIPLAYFLSLYISRKRKYSEINVLKGSLNNIEKKIHHESEIPLQNIKIKISQLQSNLSDLSVLYKKYEDTFNEVQNIKNEVNYNQRCLNNIQESLEVKMHSIINRFNRYIPFDSLDNAENISININEFINKGDKDLELSTQSLSNMLIKKQCTTPEQYRQRRAEFIQKEKFYVLVNQNIHNIEALKSNFLQDISIYSFAPDYNSALPILNKLYQYKSGIEQSQHDIQKGLELAGLNDLNDSELENTIKSYKNIIKGADLECSYSDIMHMRERLKSLRDMELDKKRDEIKDSMFRPLIGIPELEEDLIEKQKQLKNADDYLKGLVTAKEILSEVSDEIRKEIGPCLDEKASNLFQRLTMGKYNKIEIQNDFSILIRTESINRKCDIFSSGTIDQAYLALRLSAAKALAGDSSIPLLLDDILARYDDKRLEAALTCLNEHASEKDSQVILFTCHKYISDCSEKLNIPVILKNKL